MFLVLLIIAFFFFLGCPYEFVKCYLARNDKSDDDDDDDSYEAKDDDGDNEREPLVWYNYIIIFFLIVLGVFMQPLYLMFYILMGMMELYRQCGCWVFFAYS